MLLCDNEPSVVERNRKIPGFLEKVEALEELPPNSYSEFITLPVSLKIAESTAFKTATNSDLFVNKSEEFDTLVSSLPENSGKKDKNFVLFGESGGSKKPSANSEAQVVNLFEIIIENRTTYFNTFNAELGSLPNSPSQPLITFSVYKDSAFFERILVNSRYLFACLNKHYFSRFLNVQSNKVIMDSVSIRVSEKKDWRRGEVAPKLPHNILSYTNFRVPGLRGRRNSENFTIDSQLLFVSTLQADVSTNGVNRSTVCPGFKTTEEILNSEENLSAIREIETAFNSSIILSDLPRVELNSCYSRGGLVHKGAIQFVGLRKNASNLKYLKNKQPQQMNFDDDNSLSISP